MRLVIEKLQDLRGLYITRLRLLFSAEQQLVEALPRMADKATDSELKQAFQNHLEETITHVTRLEGILNHTIGVADARKCGVLAALIDEAEEMIQDSFDTAVLDAALIAVAQQVEHYEIAGYGTVRQYADTLGLEGDIALLTETMKEEKHADQLLSEIADRINPSARKAA